MAVHQIAAGKQMLVVGPAKLDIKGATYEQHFRERDFTLPQEPTLTALAPNSAEIGGEALTMEVNGTGFTEESVITFNGGEETTTFVNPSKLTTGVQPATASVPGSYPVTVRTFSHETDPQTFTFTQPAARRGKR